MKKFRFSLQKVLGFKKQELKMLKQHLAIFLMEKHRVEEFIEQLKNELEQEYELVRNKKKTTAEEKIQQDYYQDKLKADIYGQQLVLIEVQRKIKEKQDAIIKKQGEIDIFSKLKEKQFEDYMYEYNLDERKFMDEIASSKRR